MCVCFKSSFVHACMIKCAFQTTDERSTLRHVDAQWHNDDGAGKSSVPLDHITTISQSHPHPTPHSPPCSSPLPPPISPRLQQSLCTRLLSYKPNYWPGSTSSLALHSPAHESTMVSWASICLSLVPEQKCQLLTFELSTFCCTFQQSVNSYI